MPTTATDAFRLPSFRGFISLAFVTALLVMLPVGAFAQTVSSAGNWVQASPATSPSARYAAAEAYDAATGTVVLFGGTNGGGTYLADTWTWNGTTWTQQSPATVPTARQSTVMAYNPVNQTVLMFGGLGVGNVNLNDTWIWNGSNWTQQSPATSPGIRFAASLAFDPATNHMLLFGGRTGASLGDTWSWDGTTWTKLSPAASPSVRNSAAMAYDPGTGNVVLFGGNSGVGNLTYNDTWTWNGTTWTQLSPTTSPSVRLAATMAYDANVAGLILFSGKALSTGRSTTIRGSGMGPPGLS